jgi:hypothetical protein
MRILNMSLKLFQHVCEGNGIAKHLATPFSRALWGQGALWDKLAHRGRGNSNTSGISIKRNKG